MLSDCFRPGCITIVSLYNTMLNHDAIYGTSICESPIPMKLTNIFHCFDYIFSSAMCQLVNYEENHKKRLIYFIYLVP